MTIEVTKMQEWIKYEHWAVTMFNKHKKTVSTLYGLAFHYDTHYLHSLILGMSTKANLGNLGGVASNHLT